MRLPPSLFLAILCCRCLAGDLDRRGLLGRRCVLGRRSVRLRLSRRLLLQTVLHGSVGDRFGVHRVLALLGCVDLGRRGVQLRVGLGLRLRVHGVLALGVGSRRGLGGCGRCRRRRLSWRLRGGRGARLLRGRCLGGRGRGTSGLLELGGLALCLFLGLALCLFFGLALCSRLGLDSCALFGFLACAFLLRAEHAVAIGDDLTDRLRDQRARADRVVVARHDEVDAVRVAVGVDQPDDRDAQTPRLFDRDLLGFEVDHEHRVGHALHVLDTAEVRAQLLQVGLRRHALARRQQRQLALCLVAFEVVQASDALVDGLEVRQQPAEPAVVDIRHVGGLGDFLDRVACLLLGSDEQDCAAAKRHLAGELLRLRQQRLRLEQIDDVDAAALTVDEAAHLGVPAARLVAEMDAGLQQLRDSYVSHGLLPC